MPPSIDVFFAINRGGRKTGSPKRLLGLGHFMKERVIMNWFKKIEIKPKVLVIDNFPIERHQCGMLERNRLRDVIEAENTDAIKHYIRTEV